MARFLPPSFAKDQEGQVHCARGDRNVQRWDGIASAFVDSGVPATSAAITVGSSGNGTIVGRIYAYQRMLDAAGRVSNLSTVSAVHQPGALSGSVTAATNAAPIVVTSASHGMSNGDTVKIVGVLGNTAANGIYTVANVATNTFELSGSIGNGNYAAGGTWKKGRQTINYTSVTVPTDSRVVRRQILRNKDGDVKTFYIDVSSTDLSATSFNSTNTDAQLTADLAVPLVDQDGNDLAVSINSEPPNWKRSIVHHKGRMWLAGQWTYREGAVILTSGSATVTGIQTNFTSAMVGWEFWPYGHTTSYTVTAVNTSTQALTIEATYGGSSDAYSYYALTPPVFNSNGGAERRTIYFSEAGLPCSWDLGKSLTVPEERESGEITGLISYNSVLFIGFEKKLMRLSYSVRPHQDGQAYTALYRGLVNQNAFVQADGVLYIMDRRGIYLFSGNSDQDISAPIRPMFDGTGRWRINWRKTEYFHAAHFPEDATIKFFVVLTGGAYPQHALCYHYRNQRWWIEEYPVPITSSCVGELAGRTVVFLGTTGRRVLLANEGCLDGVRPDSGVTVRGTVTGAGFSSLTDSTAAFTSAVVGLSVRIVSGTGAGQQRTIYAISGTTVLKVSTPWLTKPDTTSVYQVGGIKWTYRTGWFRWALQKEQPATRGVDVTFEPTVAASRLAANVYPNLTSTAQIFKDTRAQNGMATTLGSADLVVDTTQVEGHARQELSSTRAFKTYANEKVRVGLTGVPNAERQKVYEVIVEGAGGR